MVSRRRADAARPARRPRAIALVDALAAAVILSIALAAVVSIAGQAARSQRRGEDLQTAAMLADEALALVVARGVDDYAKRFPVAGRFDPPFDRFEFQLAIGAGTESTPFPVKATVTWESTGARQSLVVETALAAAAGEDPDPDRVPPEAVVRNP